MKVRKEDLSYTYSLNNYTIFYKGHVLNEVKEKRTKEKGIHRRCEMNNLGRNRQSAEQAIRFILADRMPEHFRKTIMAYNIMEADKAAFLHIGVEFFGDYITTPTEAKFVKNTYLNLKRRYNKINSRRTEEDRINCCFPDQTLLSRLIYFEDRLFELIIKGFTNYDRRLAKVDMPRIKNMSFWRTNSQITYTLHITEEPEEIFWN